MATHHLNSDRELACGAADPCVCGALSSPLENPATRVVNFLTLPELSRQLSFTNSQSPVGTAPLLGPGTEATCYHL